MTEALKPSPLLHFYDNNGQSRQLCFCHVWARFRMHVAIAVLQSAHRRILFFQVSSRSVATFRLQARMNIFMGVL